MLDVALVTTLHREDEVIAAPLNFQDALIGEAPWKGTLSIRRPPTFRFSNSLADFSNSTGSMEGGSV